MGILIMLIFFIHKVEYYWLNDNVKSHLIFLAGILIRDSIVRLMEIIVSTYYNK
jgi:hypothetical protein